ncbi:divalent-cation tolerance protein CutA [Candidatus Roizmanbacteria bacterium]|nr:divalent-cation tolerance protein CutA [Candidatus Roizmanbacteria bacterium]
MTNIILIYTTCKDVEQAKQIGKHLLEKRLCACINIFPEMNSLYFWPPKSGTIDEGKEAVLIVKTLESKYQEVEKEIHKVHSYDVPCIMAISLAHVSKDYGEWIEGEVE